MRSFGYYSRTLRKAATAGMTRTMARVVWLVVLALSVSSIAFAHGDDPSGAPGKPDCSWCSDMTGRVANLEAYVTNGTPKNLVSPGPGHNAWMMTSTALVLFMTLPGLALFYGGLVRRKNVLSVMAQCLGCAGIVTILWWAVGYSLVFASGSPLIGGLKYAFLRGVGAEPNPDYGAWVLTASSRCTS